jgi:hypothetical protein
MFDELCESMTGAGWGGVEEVKQRWHQEYKDRKIISEFIKVVVVGWWLLMWSCTLYFQHPSRKQSVLSLRG